MAELVASQAPWKKAGWTAAAPGARLRFLRRRLRQIFCPGHTGCPAGRSPERDLPFGSQGQLGPVTLTSPLSPSCCFAHVVRGPFKCLQSILLCLEVPSQDSGNSPKAAASRHIQSWKVLWFLSDTFTV